MNGRGFALPLVVLLTMIGAIMAAVMIERQAAQQMSVNRQLARYETHHAGRGIQETIASWLKTLPNEPIEGLVGTDGHALDVELDDGRVISVFVKEGQGKALARVSGLEGSKAAAALGVVERLRVAVGDERLREFVRQVGPVPVSANTASEEVLLAAAEGVLARSAAERFVEFILSERASGRLAVGKLTQACNAAGAEPEERTRLLELVTDKPTLYLVTAEVRGAKEQSGQVWIMGATTILQKYEGWAVMESKQGRTSQQDLLSPLKPFVSWGQAEPEPDGGNE